MSRIEALCGIDRRALAGFRVGLALMLLADTVGKLRYASAFYTDAGILPLDYLWRLDQPVRFSVYLLNGSLGYVLVLFAFTLVAAIALLVGCRTRLATVVAWILVASLHARQPANLSVDDRLLRMLLFWSMFLPLGAWFSLDRIKRPADPIPQVLVSVATFGLLAQVFLMFVFSGLFKTHSETWLRGEGVYYALESFGFGRPLGHVFLGHPQLLRVMGWSVITAEALGPFLLFSPVATLRVRTATLAAYASVFVGFGLFLSIERIPYLVAVALVPFVPGFVWARIEAGVRPLKDGLLASALVQRITVRLASRARPEAGVPWRAGAIYRVGVPVILAYVFLWNLSTVNSGFAMPRILAQAGEFFFIDQTWGMFTRTDAESGWIAPVGNFAEGSEVNLFTGGGAWDPPTAPENLDLRWRSYFTRLSEAPADVFLPAFTPWLCHEWRRSHPDRPPQRVAYFYMRLTAPPMDVIGPHAGPERVVLGTFACP